MSRFSNHWRTVSGVVGGFSAGAAVSVLLLRHYDNYATTAAATSAPSGLLMPSIQNEELRKKPSITRYDAAIQTSRALILQVKEEIGIPGVCVAVNINGETAWTEGFGFADVENCVPCTPKTVMRIASISKSLTMTALAKHWEMGKIDLDLPVQHYLPKFPSKTFNGKSVEITTRMLVSHLSGIRHWKGDEEPKASKKSHEVEEMYLNIHFKTVEDALSIFENDELVHKPGSKYLYSSPAWTLVSAVMEKASGKSYKEIMTNLCNELRLRHTRLDENGPLTRNRARYYTRNKRGTLINSPCVDNSCKWAGGGFQSTVGDLVKFGDAMLFCYQGGLSGFLKKDTIDALWTISPKTLQEPKRLGPTSGYGMGWAVTPALYLHGGVEPQAMSINHTGGAVGASSILLIVPHDKTEDVPTGVTVAITVNLQSVRLSQLAHDIAQLFWNAHVSLA